jgi:hypothetical protein
VATLEREETVELLREIAALVRRSAPHEVNTQLDLALASFSVRAAGTADAIASLFEQGYDSAAVSLRRGLADDCIQVAWLLARPDRVMDWVAHSILVSVRASERARALGVDEAGIPLSAERCAGERAAFQGYKQPPRKLSMAQEADAYWAKQHPGRSRLFTDHRIEIMYYLRFADDSEHTHASPYNIFGVSEDARKVFPRREYVCHPADVEATVDLLVSYLNLIAVFHAVNWLDADELWKLKEDAHQKSQYLAQMRAFAQALRAEGFLPQIADAT